MAGKHLSQDELQYVIDVKTAQAQQGIHKLEKQTTALRNENKQRLRQMVELEAKAKKVTEQYKNLSAVYRETGQQIKKLTEKIKEQTRTIDTNVMTMSQLRNQAKSLQRELDNVSRTLNPELYNQLQGRLRSVTARMEEHKISARGFKETFVSDWYISLKHENNFEIAIIDKNHETIPEGFRQQSKGIILNFEVEDVDKIYERISEDKNMNILLEIQNEEWGQRHFIFEGPDNLLIDVIQIIEPTEEFLKQYK